MKPVIKLPKTEIEAAEIIKVLDALLSAPIDEADLAAKKLQETHLEVLANQRRLRGAHSQN